MSEFTVRLIQNPVYAVKSTSQVPSPLSVGTGPTPGVPRLSWTTDESVPNELPVNGSPDRRSINVPLAVPKLTVYCSPCGIIEFDETN